MSRTATTLILAIAFAAALLWAGGAGIVAWRGWPDIKRVIEREQTIAKQACLATYVEEDARGRCQSLHDVHALTKANVAIAGRATIALLPLAGLGLWMALNRRGADRSKPAVKQARKQARKVSR